MNHIPYYFTLTETERINTIEALIFAAEEVVIKSKLVEIINSTYENNNKTVISEINELYRITIEELDNIIDKINEDLAESNRPYKIVEFANGYQFATTKQYGKSISFLIKSKNKKRLTNAMLEVLSIVVYKQPIAKPEIEQIRGVNSKEVLNNLLDRNLVKIIGRSESLGKALLYGTTSEFLQTFGLKNLEELPKLRELEEIVSDSFEDERESFTLKIDEKDIEDLRKTNINTEIGIIEIENLE